MSNYPLGAENDSNAPFNQKELEGEYVGLFEYLDNNCEMPYQVRVNLQNFIKGFELSKVALKHLAKNFKKDYSEDYALVLKTQILLREPQIFIEN